jgi:hypothetical protein
MSLAPVLPADPGRSNDRVLPHDLLAEQSTLGAMLISQEAVAEVFEYVHGPDFTHRNTKSFLKHYSLFTEWVNQPMSLQLPISL